MLAKLLDGFTIKTRRDRKIEETIALCATLFINLVEKLRELVVIVRVVNVGGQVVHTLSKRVPDIFVNALRFRELDDGLFHRRAKFIAVHFGARETDDGELCGQESLLHETVERGHEFAFRQIAARAEDDDGARLGCALKTN